VLLSEKTPPPTAPAGVHASRQADGSVDVSWGQPLTATDGVKAFDVLCAGEDGPPPVASAANADFSICTPQGIERRALPLADGTTLHPAAPPSSGSDPLSPPRPTAVCAHVGADQTSARVTGLSPDKRYRFVVVAADAYGNGAASTEASLEPLPPPHGGCSVGGGARSRDVGHGVLALQAAALLLLARRRRSA
jgi:hypothetical protein